MYRNTNQKLETKKKRGPHDPNEKNYAICKVLKDETNIDCIWGKNSNGKLVFYPRNASPSTPVAQLDGGKLTLRQSGKTLNMGNVLHRAKAIQQEQNKQNEAVRLQKEKARLKIEQDVTPLVDSWHDSVSGKRWHNNNAYSVQNQDFVCSLCGTLFETHWDEYHDHKMKEKLAEYNRKNEPRLAGEHKQSCDCFKCMQSKEGDMNRLTSSLNQVPLSPTPDKTGFRCVHCDFGYMQMKFSRAGETRPTKATLEQIEEATAAPRKPVPKKPARMVIPIGDPITENMNKGQLREYLDYLSMKETAGKEWDPFTKTYKAWEPITPTVYVSMEKPIEVGGVTKHNSRGKFGAESNSSMNRYHEIAELSPKEKTKKCSSQELKNFHHTRKHLASLSKDTQIPLSSVLG